MKLTLRFLSINYIDGTGTVSHDSTVDLFGWSTENFTLFNIL